MIVAALFVQPGGVYAGRPDVDPWPADRDARAYPGPWPVVAHPPCASWGAYSRPIPASRARGPLRGEDDGLRRSRRSAGAAFSTPVSGPRA